jgi:ferredoxin
VAIDAARSCIRLGCEKVTVVYRRTRAEMPADPVEVQQAEEEGVSFLFLTVPVEVRGKDEAVTALHCLRAQLGQADQSGRRRPVPIAGSDHYLDVDAVIAAIGQVIEPDGLNEVENLKWSKRGTISTNTVTTETGSEGIFAAGDAVTGPATVIEAIGAGKRAAEAIDRYLQGIPQPKTPPVPVRHRRLDCLEVPAFRKMTIERPHTPLLGSDRRRITFQQVELGLTEREAREEALRCLRCDICRRCGLCVQICTEKMKVDALQISYFDFGHPAPTDFRVTSERCIACGACATNCPNNAMQISDRNGQRTLSLCGTILNKLELEYCDKCGKVLGPTRYHDFISLRTRGISSALGDAKLCMECARKVAAERHADSRPAPPIK